MSRNLASKLTCVSGALLLAVVLISCEGMSRRFPTDEITSPFAFFPGQTGVRFINLTAKTTQLDFIVATKKIAAGASYKFASAIFNVGSGSRTMQIKTVADPPVLLSEFNITVDPTKIYTVVTYDRLENYQYTILESVPKVIGTGKSQIRFFHGTKDISGTVDIRITNEKGTRIIEGVNFGNVTEFWETESGKNNIIVLTSGTNSVIMTVVGHLESGKVYSAFMTGINSGLETQKVDMNFLNESDSRAQVLFNFGAGEARIRFLHASSDAPQLDFLVDDVKILTDQPFKLASSILKIKAGSRNIKVAASGGVTPLFGSSYNFELDKSYMFLALNNYLNLGGLLFETPAKTAGGDRANLRIVHASANAPSVYIRLSTSDLRPPNFVTLSFRGISNYVEYPAGPVDVTIYQAGTTDTLKYGKMFLDGGRNYTAYILGFISGTVSSPVSFDLLIDSEPESQMLFSWF
jgi:hypothetical protein